MFRETHSRSVIKAISWRVLGTLARECALWEAPTAGARPEALRRVKYAYANVRFPRTPTDPQSVLSLAQGL